MNEPNTPQHPEFDRLLDQALAAPAASDPAIQALTQRLLGHTQPLFQASPAGSATGSVSDLFDRDGGFHGGSPLADGLPASLTTDLSVQAPGNLANSILAQTQAAVTDRAQHIAHSRWADPAMHDLLEQALSPHAQNNSADAQALADLTQRILAHTRFTTPAPGSATRESGVSSNPGDNHDHHRDGVLAKFPLPRKTWHRGLALAAGLGLVALLAGPWLTSDPAAPSLGSNITAQNTGQPATGNPGGTSSASRSLAALETAIRDTLAPIANSSKDAGYSSTSPLSAQLAVLETAPLWATPEDTLEVTTALESMNEVELENWSVF